MWSSTYIWVQMELMVKYQQTNKNISSGNTNPRAITSIAPMTMAPKVGHIYIVHNYTGQYCEQVLLRESSAPCSSAWKHPLDCSSLGKLDQIKMPTILTLDTYLQCLSPSPLPSLLSFPSLSLLHSPQPIPSCLQFTFSILLLGRSESWRNSGKLQAQEETLWEK